MTKRVWPADAVDTGDPDAIPDTPEYTGRGLRQLTVSPFVAGATAARPLGGRSGVRPGTPTSTVSATSTTWTVKPHAGVLDAQAAAEAGVYSYAVDANETGSVNAADATNPRVDIVWVRLDDPAEGDGTSVPGITFGYTAGTAAPSPSAPAAPARCMVLANINVPNSGGGSPSVTWKAPYMAGPGGVIPVRSQAERDAITFGTAEYPVYVDRLDTGAIERSVASGTWTTVTRPDVPNTQITSFGANWSGYASFPFNGVWYARSGSIVTVTGAITKSTGVSAGDVLFTMPAGYRPVNTPAQGFSTSSVFPAVQTNGNVTAQNSGSVPFSFSIVYYAGA